MRVCSVVLALALASPLAAAGHKPLKVQKHAVHTPKTANHSKQAAKVAVHQTRKVSKHKVSTPKMAKHQTSKFKKHKA